jgi:hypothetical protein
MWLLTGVYKRTDGRQDEGFEALDAFSEFHDGAGFALYLLAAQKRFLEQLALRRNGAVFRVLHRFPLNSGMLLRSLLTNL